MIKKYVYGEPIRTDAVVREIAPEKKKQTYFAESREEDKYVFTYPMAKEEAVYGLGEQIRGINKRGWHYDNWSMDDPTIHETRTALYAAHNFIVVSGGKKTFGLFIDCPSKVTYDIGYTDTDTMIITCPYADMYIIEGDSILDIVHEFRTLIGKSYIPPKWAFGFTQSRWGYMNEQDILEVADGYEKCGMPLDAIYMDIDYMERYKDFTVNDERFPDLPGLAAKLKKRGIRLVPIIDAAVKVEKGYPVYEEGCKKGYFCKDKDGKPYVVGVWPGDSVLPDVLNPEARHWFGSQYKCLLDQGIEGFWNDMNEPALFYSRHRLNEALEYAANSRGKNLDTADYNKVLNAFGSLANNEGDYEEFFHERDGKKYSHMSVHNLYGYHMTRAAGEYFDEYAPDKRILIFSRSSYIGMHRYGGLWTGDNASWWSHLLLNLKMLPSLNMCGFLYSGADIGGFGQNTTEDLLLRWLALGVFTPLMRNHSTCGSRAQECYKFKDKDAFKRLLGMRYTLLPYTYSEFIKAALGDKMLFKPLAFEYPDDKFACKVEDQLIMGDSIMIAPVYEQNAAGRYVYLPERMKMIRMHAGDDYTETVMEKGSHWIDIPLDEMVFFLREGKVMPLAKPAKNTDALDEEHLTWLKFTDKPTEYTLCRDDGYTKQLEGCLVTVKVK